MSENAVWTKYGSQGLEDYRNRRMAETRSLPRFDEAGHGGCFHDGAQALSAVRTTHDLIRNCLPQDIVTVQVLEMIETSMLVPQGIRQDAQMLCERLAKIIEAAPSGHDYNLRPFSSSTARSSPPNSPPTSTPPRVQTRPSSFGLSWTPLTRGRSQTTTTNTSPVTPQSPVSPSMMEPLSPLSLRVELPGSQPNGAFNPQNTPTPAPRPESQRILPVSPILTFDQAREWYRHAKNSGRPVDPRVEDVVAQLGNNVQGRDHIFFVDVSQSMGLHFHKITERFKILAYLAKKFDPDGVEVCFSSEVPFIHKGDTSKLLRKFNNQKWDQLSFEDRIGTFIDRIVIPRLSSWHQKLGLTRPKNLTIFVLTDGKWGENRELAAGVENPIMRLINVILTEGLSRTQVAIQFLRFGDDPDGKNYLKFLDNCGTKYKW